MWYVHIYGYERELHIPCVTYINALRERDVRQGMGLWIEINQNKWG